MTFFQTLVIRGASGGPLGAGGLSLASGESVADVSVIFSGELDTIGGGFELCKRRNEGMSSGAPVEREVK